LIATWSQNLAYFDRGADFLIALGLLALFTAAFTIWVDVV
jgi:hypothetical protein